MIYYLNFIPNRIWKPVRITFIENLVPVPMPRDTKKRKVSPISPIVGKILFYFFKQNALDCARADKK